MNTTQSKIREIKAYNYSAPLFVASFSSKGVNNISHIHEYVKEFLGDASLISAYDLHYEYMNRDKIHESDIVFIDSGGYERNQEHDLSDIYGKLHIPKHWNMDLYHGEVTKIAPISNIVLVNFDDTDKFDLERQVEVAKHMFSKYNFASDFLCKPTSNSDYYLNIDEICSKVLLFSNFDVLGFTEKELGASVLERCTSIYRIRHCMEKEGLELPIHVFGCIDPLNALIYFLCGADIFDGLSWLRYGFDLYSPTYLNHWAITHNQYHLTDFEVRAIAIVHNLQVLEMLKKEMVTFTKTGDWQSFTLQESIIGQVKEIVEYASKMVRSG